MSSTSSGVKNNAFAGEGDANAKAASLYNPLASSYASLATGNVGLTPEQKAAMVTDSGQAVAGSTAATIGRAGLEESRTGNAGSYAALADAALRGSQAQASDNALKVDQTDADLAEKNRILGLNGEQNLLEGDQKDALSYLNIANNAQPSFLSSLGQNIISTGLGVGGKWLGPRNG